jgi:diadenosine tetraphosphate (Ap4A) HIT family hydrolase
MPDPCLFCDSGASRILCESPGWYVRHDNYPATPGHVEVVPKRHIVSLLDLSDTEIAEAWELLCRARALLLAEYDPDGWNVGINDGRAAGRTVHHLHIHLIPRYAGDQPDPRGGIRRGLPGFQPLADAWTAAKENADA